MSDDNIIKLNKAACVASISKLYLNQAMADVHFVFNNDGDQLELVPANKSILAASSPVFESMFYGHLKEENHVKIVDASIDGFKEFLQFFYLAEVKLTVENVAEVMNLLNRYNVREHINACEEFLLKSLTDDNIIVALKLAIALDLEKLKHFCTEKVGVSSKTFFASDGFRQCSRAILKLILQVETFTCSECQIFDACMTWAENACVKNNLNVSAANCREQLGDCLHMIQFDKMTSNEVRQLMDKHMELFSKSELVELFKTFTSESNSKRIFRAINRNYINDHIPFYEHGRRAINITRKMSESFKDIYYMQQQECLFFQVNKRLLLGALSFYFISSVAAKSSDLNGLMTIRKLSLDSNNDDNILMKQAVTFYSIKTTVSHNVKFLKIFPVEPNVPYEIRFNFSNWQAGTFLSYKSSTQGLVRKDEYRILFGQYTKTAAEKGMESLISTLHFNRL